MAGELKNRLAELKEERRILESALLAISQKLPLPEEAYKYLNVKMGADAALVQGATGYDMLMRRWEQVNKEINKGMPFLSTRPVAIRVNVLGKDLSQYETP